MIGRHQYHALKNKHDQTEKEMKLIRDYEDEQGITESNKRIHSYFKKLYSQSPQKDRRVLSYKEMESIFKDKIGDQCVLNPSIQSVILYFSMGDWFKSKAIWKFKHRELKPSREKGLMLIGHYGNGKSTSMRVIEQLLKEHHLFGQFKGYTANEIVEMYEECETPMDKKTFWKRMLTPRIYIDDVKTEREASNYGKSNLIKEIIEKRYDKGLLTHISCNYKSGHPGDLEHGIAEFGEKYGGRVLDRIFEMFNIIEFKEKSFRK